MTDKKGVDMKKFLLLLSVGAMVFMSGCASAKQYAAFPDQKVAIEDTNKGRIYLMRPATLGCAIPMFVTDSGTEIGHTGAKTYLCWEREPGIAKIASRSEATSDLDVTVEKGSTYYIEQQVKMGFAFARNKVVLVDEQKGKKILKKCKPPKVEKKQEYEEPKEKASCSKNN
jgi:DNA topoisomerase IB